MSERVKKTYIVVDVTEKFNPFFSRFLHRLSYHFTRVESQAVIISRSFYMQISHYLYRERIVMTSHERARTLCLPTSF